MRSAIDCNKKRKLDIQVDVEKGLVGCFDPSKIEQVMGNLVNNAVKYGMQRPIYVFAKSSEDGRKAEIRITDQGIGISAVDQNRIFGRFERAVSTKTYGGLGLGLFIANEIVTTHGGSIHVESTEGKGSTFVVELPL